MSTIDDVLVILRRIEAKLDAKPAAQADGAGATDTFSPDKLSASWADKEIKRLPKNWRGRGVIGMHYSDLTSEEASELARVAQWKSEHPQLDDAGQPKKKDNGKTWAESDAFEAKLLRTWSVAAQGRPPPAAKPPATSGAFDGFGADEDAGEDLPF